MKITDNRTITVEIDGVKHKMTLDDIQRMYDELGDVTGVRRHGSRTYDWGWPSYPYRITYGATDTVVRINTSNSSGRDITAHDVARAVAGAAA